MSVRLGGDDTAERHHRAARITGLLEGNRKDRVRLNGLWRKPSNRQGLLAWPSGSGGWVDCLPPPLNAEDRFLSESVSYCYRGS